MVGCQKDDNSISSNDSNHSGVKMTMRTYEDLSHNQNFVKTFNYITKEKDPGLFSRGFGGDVEGLNGFVIDSSQIKEITTEYYKTYTMFVSRDEETPTLIENIMIVEVENEITDVFLIKHRLESDVTRIENHNTIYFESTQEIEPIDYTGEGAKEYPADDCILVIDLICNTDAENMPAPHAAGPDCMVLGDLTAELTWLGDGCDNDLGGGTGGSTIDWGDPVEPGDNGPSSWPIGPTGYGYYFGGVTGSNLGSSTTNYSANQAIKNFRNSLSPELAAWWMDSANNNQVNDIKDFLEENGFSDENEAFAIEVIQAEMEGRLISAFPFFKYPPGSNYAAQYENLTILLQEYIPYLSSDTRLVNTIHDLTDVSVNDIIHDMQWGNGPEVHIEDLGVDENGEEYKAKFNPSEPDKIYLDIDLVNYLEQMSDVENPTQQEQEELGDLNALIVFAVCLHELVHYEDFQFDGSMQDTPNLELGLLFEELFVGGYWEFDPNGNVIKIKP